MALEGPAAGGLAETADMRPEQPEMQPSDGMQQASPEEQEQYERFVTRAIQLIYADETLPAILDTLRTEDPKMGLATAAVSVISRVASMADQAGTKLSPDVVMEAGGTILEDLANLATKAGIHDFESDPDSLEGAFFEALDQFRGVLTEAGEINQEAAAADMEKLVAMDQAGELEPMIMKVAGRGASQERAPARPESGGGMAEAAGMA